jgi:hypothetical protein
LLCTSQTLYDQPLQLAEWLPACVELEARVCCLHPGCDVVPRDDQSAGLANDGLKTGHIDPEGAFGRT